LAEEAFRAFIEGGTRLLNDSRAELKCSPEVEAIFYEIRDSLGVTQYLHGLQGRYLLLLGEYPGCQTPEDTGVRRFLELVENSKVKPMGTGSHFLPMEHPELVLKEIRAFFKI
jgi:pimeloyl-ACP methyl ester carboxylesterase